MSASVLFGARQEGALLLPELITPRLMIRPMLADDIEPILARVPETGAGEQIGAVPTHDDLAAMHLSLAEEWRAHGLGYLMVFALGNAVPIGHVRLKAIPRPSGGMAAEISYGIDAVHRRQGLGSEAVAAALLFAFERAGVDPVIAQIEAGNAESLGVARRNGFRRVGDGMLDGTPVERYLLSRAAWAAQIPSGPAPKAG